MSKPSVGILLANIGTPDAATQPAVRRYLKEFLSDPRIIELPAIAWQPLLRGFILPLRSKNSALLYQKIWTEQGSPLLVLSRELANHLQDKLQLPVVLGMRYGNPSIQAGLESLRAQQVERILIFPLYPQYSGTTTASTFDAVANTFKNWRYIPEICTINHYAAEPLYIEALAHSIQQHWEKHGKAHLLFSFHGIPQQYVDAGDPYPVLCQQTVNAVTAKLQLQPKEWSLAFQSRLGPKKWLMPYTTTVLESLPKAGVKEVHVICPGFAVDCLETLEEIAMRGQEQFLEAGGETFHYIPALNSGELHVQALSQLALNYLQP